MRKIITVILVLFTLSAQSQIVNKFRDSTWFKAGVRFDSTLVFSKGAASGKVLTSDAAGRATWQTFTASGVSQSALDDSITAVRDIRKVDTLYKNGSSDSIVYLINGVRYAILDKDNNTSTFTFTKNATKDSIIATHDGVRSAVKDSIGTPQTLSTTYADSITLSISDGNSIKFSYAVDSFSITGDSAITFKGGNRYAYSIGSYTLTKNTARDSFYLNRNGILLSAVKDSTGGGSGGAALSDITSATDTNTTENLAYMQELKWGSLTSGVGLKLSSSSVNATSGNTILDISSSGTIATGQTTYGMKITNSKASASGGTNYGLNIAVSGSSLGIGLNLQNSTSNSTGINIESGMSSGIAMNGNKMTLNASGTAYIQNSGSTVYQINGAQNAFNVTTGTSGYWAFLSSASGTNIFSINRITNNSYALVFGGDYLGVYRGEVTSSNVIKASGGTMTFCANTGLTGGFSSFTPTDIMSVYGTNTNVGIGTTTPVASAALEISSTTKGFLPPRATGLQIEAVSSPATGLMFYCTNGNGSTITSTGWWGYDGAAWVKLN